DANSGGRLKRDDYNRTAEDYESMGLPVPKELEEDDEHMQNYISMNPDEVEYEFYDCLVSLGDFMTVIDHPQIGSLLFTKQNFQIHIAESSEEVAGMIWYLQRNRWERFKEDFKAIIRYIFGGKKKKS